MVFFFISLELNLILAIQAHQHQDRVRRLLLTCILINNDLMINHYERQEDVNQVIHRVSIPN